MKAARTQRIVKAGSKPVTGADVAAGAEPDTPLVPRVGLLLDALPEAVVVTDTAHRVTGWNMAAERLFGRSRAQMLGSPILEMLDHQVKSATEGDVKSALDRGETWVGGATARKSDGSELELRFTAAAIGKPRSPDGYVIVAHDVTAQVRAEHSAVAAEARFVNFMAAAPAMAFIKDHAGRYVFVNEHALGVVGDRLRLGWKGKTDYDLWPPAIAAQIRDSDRLALAQATPLETIQVVPLEDGPHTMLIRKFALRSATGEQLLGGVGLDITDRVAAAAKAELDRERDVRMSVLATERAIVAEALSRLRISGTVETVATSIARLMLGLPNVGVAAVLLFEADGRATPIGVAVSSGAVPERRSLPLDRSRRMHRRARSGAWVEAWQPSQDDPLDGAMRDLEVSTLAYAPIRSGRDLLGLLAVGATGTSPDAALTDRLPAIVEFAGLAGAVLAPGVVARRRYRSARNAVRLIIERTEFHPVFQPIVELVGRTTVGFEALTRFDDGTAPDAKFDEAVTVGLGRDLEVATLRASLGAAKHLPPGHWLNVNVSPALILAGDAMHALVRAEDRMIVCEVTEHFAIEDYAIFQAALDRLDGVQLAVDDAGAGFASFRHILELRPAFVKLDRSLVAGIDGDPVRQALIVGMSHFALAAGCRLVAEGIETEAELAMLVKLGVPLGQGYLLGRPSPVPSS